jgi:hypothetical protein
VGGGKIKENGKGGQICWSYYVFMYENGKMRAVELF